MHHFISDKPVTQSKLYQLSLRHQLLNLLTDADTNLQVKSNEELSSSKPRNGQHGEQTRFVFTYRKQISPIVEEVVEFVGVDDKRLSVQIDVDEIVRILSREKDDSFFDNPDTDKFKETFANIVSVLLIEFCKTVSQDTSALRTYDDWMTSALSAFLSIAFNDPLDVWIDVTLREGKSGEPNEFVYIRGIRPRFTN